MLQCHVPAAHGDGLVRRRAAHPRHLRLRRHWAGTGRDLAGHRRVRHSRYGGGGPVRAASDADRFRAGCLPPDLSSFGADRPGGAVECDPGGHLRGAALEQERLTLLQRRVRSPLEYDFGEPLPAPGTYVYEVTATAPAGTFALGPSRTGTTGVASVEFTTQGTGAAAAGPPSVAVLQVQVALGTGGPVVQWNAVQGAATYTVQRQGPNQCCAASRQGLTDPVWYDGMLPQTGTYTYAVTALSTTGATIGSGSSQVVADSLWVMASSQPPAALVLAQPAMATGSAKPISACAPPDDPGLHGTCVAGSGSRHAVAGRRRPLMVLCVGHGRICCGTRRRHCGHADPDCHELRRSGRLLHHQAAGRHSQCAVSGPDRRCLGSDHVYLRRLCLRSYRQFRVEFRPVDLSDGGDSKPQRHSAGEHGMASVELRGPPNRSPDEKGDCLSRWGYTVTSSYGYSGVPAGCGTAAIPGVPMGTHTFTVTARWRPDVARRGVATVTLTP